jgi:PKD repeat protein
MKNIFLLTLAFLMNALLLTAQTPCPNLVTNGDFEVPNANFTFGLPLNTGCAFNSYAITTRFNLKCNNLPAFGDHTSGAGKFLIIENSSTVATMWSTTVTVTPNTPYTFSFWASGASGTFAPEPLSASLAMSINNGANLPLSIAIGNNPGWIQYTYSGTTPAGVTTLPIAIKQITGGLGSSTYGIDDIVFTSCSPEPPCLACATGTATTNLVANGSFTNGNTGFTSQLTNSTGCGTGLYGIATNFPTFCTGWGPLSPHSGPNFLALDGNSDPTVPTVLWQTPVTLTPQTDYCFSFYWALAFAHPSQNFPISIDIVNSAGVIVANANAHVGDLTVATNLNWTQKIATWSSGSLTGAHFIAIRQLTGSIYRDWAIDDICFTAKPPTPCDAVFTSAAVGSCGNYQFTNISTGTGLTYAWIFGDPNSGGNNSTAGQSPTHQFSTCGSYIVRLIIAGPDCRDTAFQTINYTETTPPVIVCPPNISVTCTKDTIPSVSGVATATDNCPGTITFTHSDVIIGTLPCNATIRRTWTARDSCGNVSSCVQSITVNDNVPPTIVCPQSYSVNTNAGLCYYTGTLTQPTATDNCGQTPTIICSLITQTSSILITPQTQFPKGINTISCIARDACGNTSAACTFTLTVIDNEKPKIICPLSISVVGTITPPSTQCKAIVNGLAPTVTDNCTMWTIGYTVTGATTASGATDASGTMFLQGISTVTYIVTDMAGNKDSCKFTVTVRCESQGLIVTKYNDLNCNGKRDSVGGVPTDPSVNGFNFTVTNVSTGQVFTGTTIGAGQISFPTLPLGTYTVTETQQSGWIPTNPASGTMTVVVSGSGVTNVSFGNCKVCVPTPRDSLCDAPTDVLFILDNSGSVEPNDFQPMRNVVNNAITQINATYSNAKFGLVHYGGNCGEKVYVEHDFQTAAFFLIPRRFPPGVMDDLNVALGNTINALDHVTSSNLLPTSTSWLNQRPNSNLLVIILTDGWIGTTTACTNSAMLPYTNSNLLKQRPAAITMVHFRSSIFGISPVAAAIASPGGNYLGPRNNNGFDYSATGPRQYIPWSFTASTTLSILPALSSVCDSSRIDCCDSLVVTPTTTTTPNTCCTSLNLKNKVGTKVVKFEVELLNSPCWQFQTASLLTAAGFNWTTTGQKITLAHNSGQFPIGTTNAALSYCLASNCTTASATQTVVFRWFMQDPRDTSKRIICTDTLRTNCPRTAGQNCLALVDSTVRCNPDNPYEYFFNFRVQNFTGAAMNQVIMHGLPAGYSFSVCAGTFPTTSLALNLSPFPLPNNAISNTICVKIIAPFPILSPTTVCFKLGFQNDSICCHATDSVCVLLKPCCDPCDGIDAVAQAIPNSVDGCCYKLDLKRSCKYELFSRIETEVLTPGVIFGYHALGGPDAANWFVFPGATPTLISYGPLSGAIRKDLVDDIIQFCLDNITSTSQIPQKVVVRWYTSLPPGERVLCTDTLVFNCNREVTCVKVVPRIICIPDSGKYRLTMTITNQSSIPFNATHFMVNIVSPTNLFMSPSGGSFPLIPTLPPLGTTTVTTDVVLTSGTFPTSMILSYRLGFFNGSSFDTCCFDNIRDTIVLPPCGSDTCRCGAFASLFYRPSQGGATVAKACGDTLNVLCTPTFTPVLSGVYNCLGACPTSGMKWELRKILGGLPIQSGTMGTTFSLPLLLSYFTTSGNYELTLIPQCGGKNCPTCKFTLAVQLCDTCQCRGFEAMSFYNSTWPQPLSKPAKCDSSYQLPCTPIGGLFYFHGNFLCSSKACLSDSVSWSIGQGTTRIASGKVILNMMGGLPSGHFDILLNPALFTAGVQYTITVTGMCGSQVCTCKVNFTFAPCPCPCPTFAQDVAKGFKTLGITAIGCKKTVMPIGLCPNDAVTWIVNGSSVGTSTGNASFTITFTSSGIFNVCMAVTRLNPDGSICNKMTHCRPLTVNCPQPIINVTHCTKNSATGNGVKNGNFTEGSLEGHLGFGGTVQNWSLFPNAGDGFVMVDAETGASDGGHLVFNANNANRAGVFQQITLPISTFTVVEYYARNYSGTSLPAGTVVEFRLYNEPIAGSPSQLIYSDTIPKDSLAWMRRTFSPRISPDQTKRFFNICLSNNSTTDKSTVGIDNIEVCSSTTVDTKEATVSGQFRIVPNPNQGTFTVVLSERATLGMKLRILNSIGQIVQDFTPKLGNEEQTIQAHHLPNGMYFLQVVLDGKVMGVEKFVKQ